MTILFDSHSTSSVSDRFMVNKQVTITATGLPVNGVLTFEVAYYEDGPLTNPAGFDDACAGGGFPSPALILTGTTLLRCCSCDEANSEYPVRLTSDTPYIIIDAPQKSWVRAVYTGPGIGTFNVWMEVTETPDVTEAMRGCCNPAKVDVSVTKSVSTLTPRIGDPVTYTMNVVNAGPFPANGTIFQDSLPPELTVTSITAITAGGAVSSVPTKEQIIAGWPIPVFPSGGSVAFSVTGTFATTGAYLNRARVQAPAGTVDTNPDNNGSEVLINIKDNFADLSVTKVVSAGATAPGQSVTYTLVVSNAGPQEANGAVVTDVLPAGFGVSSITATYSGGASGVTPTALALAAGLVIPVLPAGGFVTIGVTGSYGTPGSFVNEAVVRPPANRTDPNTLNNQASASISVASEVVDLYVTKTQSTSSPAIDEQIAYTVVAGNSGSYAAAGAVLRDIIPADLVLNTSIGVVGVYAGGAAGPTPSISNLNAGLVFTAFPPGGTLTVTVNGRYTTPGVRVNTATIVAPAGVVETLLLNNTATVVLVVPQVIGLTALTCDGTRLEPSDTVFTVGSLLDCNGQPITCNSAIMTCGSSTSSIVRVTNPGLYIGAGICLPIGPGSYVNGVAIMRMRDFVSEVGSILVAASSNPPAYLTFTHTNTSGVTQLIEATLMGAGNVYYGALNSAVGFTYNIGETLSINMPDMLFLTLEPGTVRQTIEVKGLNTRGGAGGTSVYHEESVGGATFTKLLAPGATVTLYSQAWITLYESAPLPPSYTVIHASMAMRARVTENGAYL